MIWSVMPGRKGNQLGFYPADWSLENTDLILRLSNWDMAVTSHTAEQAVEQE